jgi:hypothetical protein
MAESYKRLGAVAPTDDKYTLLYTSPAATEALVSNVTVTNRSASAQTFDVQVFESGVTQQSDLDDSGVPPTFIATIAYSTEFFTSADGITWTQRVGPYSDNFHYISYGGGIFISSGSGFYTSTDLTTWTPLSLSGISSGTIPALAYGSGRFVIVTRSGTTALSSTDGITWIQGTLPTDSDWKSVTHGDGTFVAVGYEFGSGARAASSTDGITWTQRTLPTSSDWQSVTYGNGTFVAVGYYPSAAASSTDGITWTQRTLPVSSIWRAVTYGNNTFVAVGWNNGNNGLHVASSTDGITWTQRTVPNFNSYIYISATYGNGTFVAMSYIGTQEYITSPDGITWTLRNWPKFDYWGYISYAEDIQPYSPPTQTTLYKTSDISANSTEILEPGIALPAQGAVVVKDNSGGNLTFSTYGVELS